MTQQRRTWWLVYVEGRELPIEVSAEKVQRDRSAFAGVAEDVGFVFLDGDEIVARFDCRAKPCVVRADAHG